MQKTRQMYRTAIAQGARGIRVPKGKKNVHTSAFHSCVTQVAKKGDVKNPYAVCMASLGKEKAIKAGHRRGAIATQSRKVRV